MGCLCSSDGDTDSTCEEKICPDYKEFENYYTGVGIKKTRAWYGNISRSNLKHKREKFWNKPKPGRAVMWMYLRQAVEADEASSSIILSEAGLFLVDFNIELTRDLEGYTYYIPIYVVNDPVNLIEQDLTKIDPIELKITIRRQKVPDLEVVVKNTEKIIEVKEEIGIKQARFFFGGKEMYNENRFVDYPIDSGMVVQAFFTDSNN